MSEIRYPVWWEPPENTNGEVESDRLAHVYEQTDGFPGDVAIARVFKPEHARRIAAALNATKGIPTETLEAGVVVGPMEDARLIGKALATCSYRDLVTYGGLSEQEYEQLQTIASRLQQNGGWWETGDQEPRRLREDCYEPGQQMGGGHGA